MPPPSTTPPRPPQAGGDSRSAVFTAIRSIFGHAAGTAPASEPAKDLPPPRIVVVRNCSTKRVLADLLAEFGGADQVSGRYFRPAVQDVSRIKAWADANGFFVKESRVADVLVLDLMVDRTKLPPGRRLGAAEDADL